MKNVKQENVIDQIAKLTDDNMHSAARILGAQYLKHEKFEKIYKDIAEIQNTVGSLPYQTIKYRYKVDKEMWKYAINKLGKVEGQRFYGAF